MTVSRVTCDRCQALILEDRTLLAVESGPLRRRRPSVDLCADCAAGLESWLKAGAPAPAGPDPDAV